MICSTCPRSAVIDAGPVVFAAGVRPRDELARSAGLATAERGGVLTDLSCATRDPNIFAVGEVAAIEVYTGTSVPPQFSMAGNNCASVVVWTRTRVLRRNSR